MKRYLVGTPPFLRDKRMEFFEQPENLALITAILIIAYFIFKTKKKVITFNSIENTAPNPHSYSPIGESVDIHYTNWKNESKSFRIDTLSVLHKGLFISAATLPSGNRISFRISNITNKQDIQAHIDRAKYEASLSAAERRQLAYHRKRGTTSEKYQHLLTKIATNTRSN